ncbi:MAG: NAD(P)H-quinone oxidoreductase chain 4 1 [Pseudomonadota bacterium]|jgi:NADH-quinone oxidoreductase subunit M
MQFPILSITILLPLASAIYIMLFVNQENQASKEMYAKYIGILSSLFTLISVIYLLFNFDSSTTGYQFVEHTPLIDGIGLSYHLGVDGISILFVVLTAVLTPICIIATLSSITKRVKEYLICFLLLESVVIGFFLSINLLLFYIFFEAMLIPMYLIIGCWGGENRVFAAIKFFIYTFFGSILFLIALVTIYTKIGSFDIGYLSTEGQKFAQDLPNWLWAFIFVAMAVKVPMLPFHTWLPDAHVQAPTGGSVMLAGILLKVGGYGMIRVLIQILPAHTIIFAPYVIYLSIAAIVYAAFVAMAQSDMKKMIAYSSVSHMGYVTAGIFTHNSIGIEGAMFQMISHGFISSGLFLVVGMLYDRVHTKDIAAYGGVAKKMPLLATFFMILTLGSIGLPGTSGFIGEFLSLIGIFKYNIISSAIAASGVILGAIYMLVLYKRVMFGAITKDSISNLRDLSPHESISLFPIIVLVIFTGIEPESVISIFKLEIANLSILI